MKLLKMFGIILITILIIITILVFYAKYSLDNIDDKGNLESIIDKETNKFIGEGNSLGIVVGIIKQREVYIKGYGTIKRDEHIKPDSSTIFELASTSKLFTTSTIQILLDKNEVDINETLDSIFNNKIELPDIAKNTTLEHLATHTSGFPSLPNSFLDKMKDSTNPYKDLVTQDIYDYLAHCEGKKSEGSFEYSNFGMGLLGHIIELKTKMGYEHSVKELLLKPLEMNNTFVTIDSLNQAKIAQGYNENNQEAPIWIDNVLTGAGSFLSNGEDMIKFLKANLSEDNSTLSKTLIKSHRVSNNNKIGLGWIYPDWLDRFMGNKHVIWHNGMAGGYASFIAIDKVNNYGIVVLSNKSQDVTYLGKRLARFVRTQSWKESN